MSHSWVYLVNSQRGSPYFTDIHSTVVSSCSVALPYSVLSGILGLTDFGLENANHPLDQASIYTSEFDKESQYGASLGSTCSTVSQSIKSFNDRDGLILDPSQKADNSLDSLLLPDYFSTLQKEIRASLVEWPKESDRFFLPCNELERLVTLPTIAKEIESYDTTTSMDRIHHALCIKTIRYEARKLFAILVSLGIGSCICGFIRENIGDKDLPFQRSDKTTQSGNYKLCSKLTPSKVIGCTASWDIRTINEFSRRQWAMIAPIFKYGDKVRHYDLEDNEVLPFMKDESSGGHVKHGGYSTVWKVTVHPAHLRRKGHLMPQDTNEDFALKQLDSTSESEFGTEVEMLRMFTLRRHPNLIKLHFTFRYRGKYYLVFPYAKSNLRQYWEENPTPSRSIETMSWMLGQCKALSSGLFLIHEHRLTCNREPISDYTEADETYGRHGDIKPENILLSLENPACETKSQTGVLLIADFGLMDLHRRLSRSLILADKVNGSPNYQPPEVEVCKAISREYDIWSLGCVFLEFLIWQIWGWKTLKQFDEERALENMDEVKNHKYYTISSRGTVYIRPSVQKCFQRIRYSSHYSAFVQDFLDLIEQHMLVIDHSQRIRCNAMNIELQRMINNAEKNPEYFSRCIC